MKYYYSENKKRGIFEDTLQKLCKEYNASEKAVLIAFVGKDYKELACEASMT